MENIRSHVKQSISSTFHWRSKAYLRYTHLYLSCNIQSPLHQDARSKHGSWLRTHTAIISILRVASNHLLHSRSWWIEPLHTDPRLNPTPDIPISPPPLCFVSQSPRTRRGLVILQGDERRESCPTNRTNMPLGGCRLSSDRNRLANTWLGCWPMALCNAIDGHFTDRRE